jgi:acyl-CoA-binding protein
MKHLKDEAHLQLYGLYKQALERDNTTSQPWAVEFVAKVKWNAS